MSWIVVFKLVGRYCCPPTTRGPAALAGKVFAHRGYPSKTAAPRFGNDPHPVATPAP